MMERMSAIGFGDRLRRAREARGWTQGQLREALPRRPDGSHMASLRAIGAWERGEAAPRNAIGALESVLGVRLTEESDPDEEELRASLTRLCESGLIEAGDVEYQVQNYRERKRRAANDGHLRERSA